MRDGSSLEKGWGAMTESGGIPQGQGPYGPYAGGQQQQSPPQSPYGAAAPQNPYGAAQNLYGPGPTMYPPEQPVSKVRRLADYKWTIGFVVVISAVGIAAAAIGSGNAARNNDNTIVKKGTLAATSIVTGDCFKVPTLNVTFSSVVAIPCDQPHTAQIYGSYIWPDATVVKPADTDISADTKCDDLAKTAVEDSKVPTAAVGGVFFADDVAWASGNHTILCAVQDTTPWSASVMK